jgi:hypothetical protein
LCRVAPRGSNHCCPSRKPKQLTCARESVDSPIDERDLDRLIWCALTRMFPPRTALEAENIVLQHQLNVLQRRFPKRVTLGSMDRLLLIGLYRFYLGVLDAVKIIRPETLIRWHCAGFRAFWRWKSRPRGSGPRTPVDNCRLIREIECRQPALGRSADRTPQTWHRRWADYGRKLHGEKEATAIAGLEDLPLQSCRRHRVDGFGPSPHGLFPAPVRRPPDPAAPSTQASVAGCNRASERRMACSTTDRGIGLQGRGAFCPQ